MLTCVSFICSPYILIICSTFVLSTLATQLFVYLFIHLYIYIYIYIYIIHTCMHTHTHIHISPLDINWLWLAVRVIYIDILTYTVTATNYENPNCNCFYRQKIKLSYCIISCMSKIFDSKLPTCLKIDASWVGVGAFLEQNYGTVTNEKWHPIGYSSRAAPDYEKCYAQIADRKESLLHSFLSWVLSLVFVWLHIYCNQWSQTVKVNFQ